MRKLLTVFLFALLSFSTVSVWAKDNNVGKPLEIGIIPYLSPRILISSYEPMRLYLENALGTPVIIYTATGFKKFFQNSQQGNYDLVLSAAHFARILQKDHQYTPLVRFAATNHASIVTSINSPIKTVHDLKGQVLAVPDQLALSSIVVFDYLHDAGLQPGIDFKIQEVPSFTSAILSVQKGEAAAAISSPGILAQMPTELSTSVKIIADTGEHLRLIFLTHPRINKPYAELIKQTLLKFSNETNEGKLFVTKTKVGAIIPATTQDMNSLDRYVTITKRLLNESP